MTDTDRIFLDRMLAAGDRLAMALASLIGGEIEVHHRVVRDALAEKIKDWHGARAPLSQDH